MNMNEEKFMCIINELTKEELYKDLCEGYTTNGYIADELYQEFFIVILEYDKDKICKMYDSNQLKYFCVGIIRRMIRSKTSPFYNKIRKFDVISGEIGEKSVINNNNNNSDYDDNLLEMRLLESNVLDKIEQCLRDEEIKNPKFWYSATLFKMYYYQKMTYRKIQLETNIHHVSAFHTIQSVVKLLREKLDIDLSNYKQIGK